MTPTTRPSSPWFLNPYAILTLGAVLAAVAEVLLKKGAATTTTGQQAILGIGALTAWWTWLGIVAYIMNFACWLYVLKRLPVGIAFAIITGAAQVLVPLGAWIALGEKVAPTRWVGIVLVLAGIAFIAQTAARVEESL